MKHWVAHRHSALNRMRLHLSRVLLRIAVRRPFSRFPFLSGVRDTAHHVADDMLELTAAPEGVALRPLRLLFTDVYFLEEFSALDRGMRRLLARARGRSTLFPHKGSEDWFVRATQRTSGGTRNVGGLDLTLLPRRLRPKLLCRAHVWAFHVSPSLISLTFSATPSEDFNLRFADLIHTDRLEEVQLAYLWGMGFVGKSFCSAVLTRQAEYDELFLEANRELARVLRHYLGVGLCMEAPLPVVEVLATDTELGDLLATWARDDTKGAERTFRHADFLRSLGYPFRSRYANDWYQLYQVQRNEHYEIGAYQLLASIPAYRRSHTSTGTPEDVDAQIAHTLHYVAPHLGASVALHGFYRRLRAAVLDVRNGIATILHAQARRGSAIRKMRRGYRTISRANALAFRQERLWTELTDPQRRSFLTTDLDDLRRDALDEPEERPTFGAGLWVTLEETHAFCQEQLTLLRAAFREVLDFATLQMNDRLQRLVLGLTIVATVATVVALVPETLRNRLWQRLQDAVAIFAR